MCVFCIFSRMLFVSYHLIAIVPYFSLQVFVVASSLRVYGVYATEDDAEKVKAQHTGEAGLKVYRKSIK